MNIDSYQERAADTVQFDTESDDAISISILGLSGEVGELATEYKKKIRDGNSYKIFREKVVEELGDILWYLSSIASYENILLSEVVDNSLKKTNDRWNDLSSSDQLLLEPVFFDDDCDESEQFPREFVAEFIDGLDKKTGKPKASIFVNNKEFGDPLMDNAYDNDYYRFHDVFHLSYVVVLGWSPVARKLLDCKRKGNQELDEVEDGGRSSVIDEAISALVFEYAQSHNFFEGAGGVDYSLLRTIQQLTKHLEVGEVSLKQWEKAILLGFEMWRKLIKVRRGKVICNMYDKSMVFEDTN